MKIENFLKYSDLQLNEMQLIELQIRVFQKKNFQSSSYLYSAMRLLNIAPLKHLINIII